MSTTTEVYYHGDSATSHKHCTLVPGINRIDSGIANNLLACGLVTLKPIEKGNPYQDKDGKFSSKENDADKIPRYTKKKKEGK